MECYAMEFRLLFYFLICIRNVHSTPINVEIDGLIDMTQNWDYVPSTISRPLPIRSGAINNSEETIPIVVPLDQNQNPMMSLLEAIASIQKNSTISVRRSKNKKAKRIGTKHHKQIARTTAPITASAERERFTFATTAADSLKFITTTKSKKKHKRSKKTKTTTSPVKATKTARIDVIPIRSYVPDYPNAARMPKKLNATVRLPKSIVELLARLGVSLTSSVDTTTTTKTTTKVSVPWAESEKPTTKSFVYNLRTTKSPEERLTMYYYLQPEFNGEDSDDYNEPLYQKPHAVKNDRRIQNFTLQIYKQNLGVFETMMRRASNDTSLRKKIDLAAKSYSTKFSDFVNETQNRQILTKLGTQKVILNTIETSNRIMRRLFVFLIGDLENKGVLRDNQNLALYWNNDIQNEEEQEYIHACQKFNICRSRNTLSSFAADIFTILLQIDNKKLKQGMDALTEVWKNTDFGRVTDKRLNDRITKRIDDIERMEPNTLRPYIWIFRNMLVNKNQPLPIQEGFNEKVVNKSVAIINIIDILDEKLPATDENMLEWNDIRNSLVQWANGQRTDVLEIMQAFNHMIMRKAVATMNSRMASNFHDKLKIIFNK